MPTSVRLDPALEARLRKLAQAEGISLSEVLRRAAARYCEELAPGSMAIRLADVLGVVRSGRGRARRTGAAFRKVLQRGHDRDRRRR